MRSATGTSDDIARQALLQPDKLAVSDLTADRQWSYGSLDRAIAQWAAMLRSNFGVVAGDRVALLAKNCAEAILLHFACARIGAIFTPFNWRLSRPEIESLIADAEPKVLTGDAQMARLGIEGIPLEKLWSIAGAVVPLPPEPIDIDRPSLMLFTSGTSGRSKGVLLSERNLLQTALNFGELGSVTPCSVFLVDAPMFHIIGILTSIRPAFLYGGVVQISDGFEPSRTLSRLGDRALGVTHYFCVPQMAQQLKSLPQFLTTDLSRLTAVFTGGAPLAAADIMSWHDAGLALINGYGMTEVGTVFGMPVDLRVIAAKPGSAGIGAGKIDTRIVDSDGCDCVDGIAGELLLRGENVFQGYWRQPNETATAFAADGWFCTGDIAMRDADGFYWILDRKKDMFISGGENIYPAEIENLLAGLPGILEAGVVGVPDERWGEVGHLAIVVAPGEELSAQAVLDHLATVLARYKLPKYVSIVEGLPRTASGKIQKNILRAQLLGA